MSVRLNKPRFSQTAEVSHDSLQQQNTVWIVGSKLNLLFICQLGKYLVFSFSIQGLGFASYYVETNTIWTWPDISQHQIFSFNKAPTKRSMNSPLYWSEVLLPCKNSLFRKWHTSRNPYCTEHTCTSFRLSCSRLSFTLKEMTYVVKLNCGADTMLCLCCFELRKVQLFKCQPIRSCLFKSRIL